MECGSPTFIQPKNNVPAGFLSNFRKLNQRIHSKPPPIPKIKDTILNLKGFTHASSLDLNMEYYHIELSPGEKNIRILILTWRRMSTKNYLWGSVIDLISSRKIYPKYLKGLTWYMCVKLGPCQVKQLRRVIQAVDTN